MRILYFNACGFARCTVSLEEGSNAARCAAGRTGSVAWRRKSGGESERAQRVDCEELVVAFASVLFNQAFA